MADRPDYPALLEAAFSGQHRTQTAGTTSSSARYPHPVRSAQPEREDISFANRDKSRSSHRNLSPRLNHDALLQKTLGKLNRTPSTTKQTVPVPPMIPVATTAVSPAPMVPQATPPASPRRWSSSLRPCRHCRGKRLDNQCRSRNRAGRHQRSRSRSPVRLQGSRGQRSRGQQDPSPRRERPPTLTASRKEAGNE